MLQYDVCERVRSRSHFVCVDVCVGLPNRVHALRCSGDAVCGRGSVCDALWRDHDGANDGHRRSCGGAGCRLCDGLHVGLYDRLCDGLYDRLCDGLRCRVRRGVCE